MHALYGLDWLAGQVEWREIPSVQSIAQATLSREPPIPDFARKI